MPKSVIIAAPLRRALIGCFRAVTRLVRPELRHQPVLVGGAVSIAHSSDFKTEDVDVAAPPSVLIQIWEGASAGAHDFRVEPDGKNRVRCTTGFRVRVDLIEIGNGCIDMIYVAEPLFEGSIASKSD